MKELTDRRWMIGDFNLAWAASAGATCSINIIFAPTVTGSRSALLVVFDNGGGTDQTASLSGTGTREPSRAALAR